MPLQQQQIPTLDPSEVEDASPQQTAATGVPAGTSQGAKLVSLDPGEVEDVTSVTSGTSGAAPTPTVNPQLPAPQVDPAIAAQVKTARTNIAQYPENQAAPDPNYVASKHAFDAVQGEPGAPLDFQYDPEQERRIAAQQEVNSQYSAVPQAAVPALGAFQRHINDPMDKMSEAGKEAMRHAADRALVTPPTELGTIGDVNTDPPTTEEEVQERLKAVPRPLVGATRAVFGTVGGMAADPRMWPFFLAGPEAGEAESLLSRARAASPVLQKTATTGFTAQMGSGAIEQGGQLKAIMTNPGVKPEDKWEAAANFILTSAMTVQGAKHVLTPTLHDFQNLSPEDQAQIRQRLQQKAPELAKAAAAGAQGTKQAPNGAQEEPAQPQTGMNAGPRPERFKPIVLDPKEVESAPQNGKPNANVGGGEGQQKNVKPGNAAAMKLEPNQTYNGKLYKTAQLENGDTYLFNPKKTNEQAIQDAAAKGELWKLTGQQAPAEARAQAERDLKGEEQPTSSNQTANEESKDVKQDFTPELHPSEVEDVSNNFDKTENVSNRFDKSESPREDADFRKRMEMSRVPEFRRELAQETDPARRQQIQDAIDRETAFVRGQASPKEIPHENLPAAGEAEKHLKDGPRLPSYRRTSDLEDDIHKSGMVYKGEVSPNSGVFQIEHPDHPGKTTTMKAADITSPEAVKAKVEAHIKANSAAPSLDDIKRRLGVSTKVDNQEPAITTKVVTHQDAADRLNAGDTEGTKAALRDLMAQKFGKTDKGKRVVPASDGQFEVRGPNNEFQGAHPTEEAAKAAASGKPIKPKLPFEIKKLRGQHRILDANEKEFGAAATRKEANQKLRDLKEEHRPLPGGYDKGDIVQYKGEPAEVVGGESIIWSPALPINGKFVVGGFGHGQKQETLVLKLKDGDRKYVDLKDVGAKEGTNAIRESGTAEVGAHAGGNEGAGRSEQGSGVGRSQQGEKPAQAESPLGGSAPLAKPKARFKISKADIVPTENGSYEARPHAAEKPAHEFASTQINIREGTEAHQIHAQATKELSDQHLAPEGRETKPHVTVRYGLKDDSPAAIEKLRSAVAGIKPFEITAGKTRAFPEGKDGVPLFSEVQHSKELNALRSAVQSAGDFKPDDHGEYKPHITLGYAKPGTEHRYVGMEGMSGAKVPVDHITVTTKDRQEVRIPLGQSADTISENGKKALAPIDRNVLKFAKPGKGGDGFSLLTNLMDAGHSEQEANSAIAKALKSGTVKFVADPEADGDTFIRTPAGTEALKGPEASGYGDKNTVFTAEKRDAALERLRKRRGQLNSGINPEDISDLIDIGGYHFEAGVRAFADWSKKMLTDVGEWAKPYLETVHEELTKHLTNEKLSTASTGLSTENGPKLSEKTEPRGAQGLIDAVYRKLQAGESLGNVTELNKLAEEHFGSSRTSGKWTPKDSFDAMEAGVNRYLLYHGGELMRMDTLDGLKELRKLMPRLTSQAVRTEEQIKNQQFSTPPTEAYLAAKIAGLRHDDVVLEPSAGNGGLAVWAKAIGAEVHVNETSERRQKMLEAAGFGKATAHDGEVINSTLDRKIKPTVILMNPPFSASTLKSYEAKNRNQYGFNHVQSALQRLEDGGRLVAILGGGKANEPNGGASLTAQASGEWFQKIADKYNVRANIRINGKEYQKYGTNFATRLLVIDKDGPTPSRVEAGKIKTWASVKQANVDTLEEAYNALRDVADSRPTRAGDAGKTGSGQDNARAGVGADKDAGTGSDRGPAQRELGGSEGAKPSDRPAQPVRSPGRDDSQQGDQRVPLREPADQSEKSAGAGSAQNSEGSDKDVGVKRPLAGTETSDPGLDPSVANADKSGLDLGRQERNDKREQEDTSAYVKYVPTLKGASHPADIVETKTMATVPLPEITYKPSLPQELIDKGGISAVQLEPVAMAGQQNDIVLPSGARSSVLIGDGTGVGKGRTGAAILMDNWRKGRKRLVWVSEKWDLMDAAQKDLENIGAGDLAKKIKSFGKYSATQPIDHEGVLFSTYALIRSEDKKGNKRVHQLQNWLRGNDEGDGAYILWDEAHNLKNAVAATGAQESQIGVAAKKLMLDNPKLRSASMSATAATDVVNLGYLDRLGLWGPGTAFPGGFNQFASQIGSGGLSAMEMVARELKSQGKYIARNLSFKGVEYRETEHVLTPEQKEVYRSATKAWKSVVQQAEKTIETTTNGGAYAKGRFMSLFYGAQLRFFNVLLTTLKIPTAVEKAEKYLKEGKSVVITLVNTNEAAQNREKNKARDLGDSDEMPDYDFGPGEMLSDLVRQHYPIQQFHDDVSSDGKPIKVPAYVKDEQGRDMPMINPEAVKERDKLLADLKKNLQMPANPLDILINSLGGPKKVAELTGRKERYDESAGKFIMRGDKGVKRDEVNLNEMRNFQAGKKDVAILSSAAGTGISLHAGNDVANQKQRAHITLQIGWSADKQMQMFGRTHRTNQAHPPVYDTITSDLGGEKRFSSTLAKRMGSLGALSRGQTDAMSGADVMEKVNFESEQGKQATNTFYSQMLRNQPIPGTKLKGMQILEDLRVLKTTDGGGVTVPDQDRFNVTRLLNRMLALDPDHQNAAYNYFYDIFQATVHDAIENGKLDTGVKTLPGDEFKIKEERSLAKDPKTNAETFYYPVDASIRTERVSPEALDKRMKAEAENNPRIGQDEKGKLALIRDARPIVHASGATVPAVYISGPGNGKWQKVEKWRADQNFGDVKELADKTLKKARQDVSDAKYMVDFAQKDVNRYNGESAYSNETLAKRKVNLQEKEAALAQIEATAKDPLAAARAEWAKQYEAAPTHTTQEHHLIGGAVMRYWNAIKEEAPGLKIYTTVDSKTGQRVVGIDVPSNRINALLARIEGGKATVTASQIRQDVLKNGMPYDLEQGIQVKRGTISRRPVVTFSTNDSDIQNNLKRLGVIHEKGVIPIYYLPDNEHGEHILENILKEYPAKEPEKNDDEETGIDRSGERGSATMSSMPIPALIEAVAKGTKKAGTLYHGAVDRLLEHVNMGKPRPEIRQYDPDAADLALTFDAAKQFHKAVAEDISKRIMEPLSEDFQKSDTEAQRQAKNETTRDRLEGFHMMGDEQNRHWLLENGRSADYHRWNSDPKITKALMEYAPYMNDLRTAVKQLGGATIDEDYIKRVMDFPLTGVAYEGKMPAGVFGPGNVVKGKGGAMGAGRDNIVGPQVDRSKARKDAGGVYAERGVFDIGPSIAKRWVEVMSKLDEHRLAVHAMSMGTRLQPGDEAPNMVYYNGKEFFRPDIAIEIERIQKHGVSSESKELADQLGISELPVPKDVHQYGIYEPLKGARFENAARNLASRVLTEPDTAGMQGQAANLSRMAKLRYAVPEEIADALNDANREKGQGRASKVLSSLLGPITQFIRQQIVGLAYGVPHMANIIRKVMQATPGSVLNPQAWANGVKIAFSKELKARGMSGVDDPTYKMLLRNAGISEGAIPEYKHYIEGNFDAANWKQTVANAFHQGGKEGARVTAGSALAGVGRMAIEPLNRFSEKGHSNLFKQGGIDQRARIWLADFLKDRKPGMSDADIAHEVNQTLGRYNRASWTDVQKGLAPYMLFPGWDYSSVTYAMKHPFKTTVAPAVLMLLANMAVNSAGYNSNEDKHDATRIHVGKYSVSSNLFNDNMGNHMFGWALRGAQGAMDGKSAKGTVGNMAKGVPSDVAGVSTSTLNPLLSGVGSIAANRERLGSGAEIVNRGDIKKKGRVLPNKAAEDYAGFAGRKLFPIYDSATEQDTGKMNPLSLARLAGVSAYKKKPKR